MHWFFSVLVDLQNKGGGYGMMSGNIIRLKDVGIKFGWIYHIVVFLCLNHEINTRL